MLTAGVAHQFGKFVVVNHVSISFTSCKPAMTNLTLHDLKFQTPKISPTH